MIRLHVPRTSYDFVYIPNFRENELWFDNCTIDKIVHLCLLVPYIGLLCIEIDRQ